MTSTQILLVFLALLRHRVHAEQCYVGDKHVRKLETFRPTCSFTIISPSENCTRPTNMNFGSVNHLIPPGEDWLCYHTTIKLRCFCRGYLCNGEANIKKILAQELGGATKEMQKIIFCFLSMSRGKELNGNHTKESNGDKNDTKDHLLLELAGKITRDIENEAKNRRARREEKKMNTRFIWFLVLTVSGVIVIAVDIVLVICIFILAIKNKKEEEFVKEKEESKKSRKTMDEFSLSDISLYAEANSEEQIETIRKIDEKIREAERREKSLRRSERNGEGHSCTDEEKDEKS